MGLTKRKASLFLLPILFLLWLYSDTFQVWFRRDDFAWLGLLQGVHGLRDVMEALFHPAAQGTIRPWSERGFFLLFDFLFGLNGVPYRIAVFLTVVLDLLLLTCVTARLSGSWFAALAASIFWIAHPAVVSPMTWNSCYNQVQYPAFVLSALLLFIRYAETGRRSLWWGQLAIFVLGLGSLESEVVYPANHASW